MVLRRFLLRGRLCFQKQTSLEINRQSRDWTAHRSVVVVIDVVHDAVTFPFKTSQFHFAAIGP